MPDLYLRPGAIAKLKGCSRELVRLAIIRGDLPAIPTGDAPGRSCVCYVVRRLDVDRWTPARTGWPKGKRRGPWPATHGRRRPPANLIDGASVIDGA